MCLLLNQKRAVVDAHDKEVLTFFRFLLVCLFSIRGAMNQYLQQNLNSLMSVWPRFSLSICLSVCLESSDTLIFNFSSSILTIRNVRNTSHIERLRTIASRCSTLRKSSTNSYRCIVKITLHIIYASTSFPYSNPLIHLFKKSASMISSFFLIA